MPKKLIFDDELLATFVATSTSRLQVAKKLRPEAPSGIYEAARNRVLELGLETKHFSRQKGSHGWTDADLRAAVESSLCLADVIRKIGLVPAGGNYDQVKIALHGAGVVARTQHRDEARATNRRSPGRRALAQ